MKKFVILVIVLLDSIELIIYFMMNRNLVKNCIFLANQKNC